MENARVLLFSRRVASPAHDSSVVHFSDWSVGQGGNGVLYGRVVPLRRHVYHVCRVVEHPSEVVGRRERVHFAQHPGALVLRHPVHSLLAPAHRFVCANHTTYLDLLITGIGCAQQLTYTATYTWLSAGRCCSRRRPPRSKLCTCSCPPALSSPPAIPEPGCWRLSGFSVCAARFDSATRRQ